MSNNAVIAQTLIFGLDMTVHCTSATSPFRGRPNLCAPILRRERAAREAAASQS
jgi:hypothetical protein